jgi:hypothetical protein
VTKPGQPGIGRRDRRNPRQTQFLDQPVLQRPERALDTALRLRAVGAKNVDVEFGQGTTELCCTIAARGILGIHPKNAVLVAVERNRLAMRLEIGARRAEIIECRFRGDKSQMHQSAGRVVDKREQGAPRRAVLTPRVFRAVNLHQFANAIAPAAWLMRRGQTMAAVDPQTRRDHPAAQRLAADRAAVYRRQLLRRQGRTKISVSFAHQRQRQITIRLRQTVIARPAAPPCFKSAANVCASTSSEPLPAKTCSGLIP